MMIKDLEMNKELDREALSTVRGGSNFAYAGGQYAYQNVSGGGFFSPTHGYNTAINKPMIMQDDNDVNVVIASAFTGIANL